MFKRTDDPQNFKAKLYQDSSPFHQVHRLTLQERIKNAKFKPSELYEYFPPFDSGEETPENM